MKNTSRGRVRRSAADWQELISRFEESGQSAREFCEKEGISHESLRRWRIQLSSEPEQSAFVPVTSASAPSPPSTWTLEITLPGGCHLRLQG